MISIIIIICPGMNNLTINLILWRVHKLIFNRGDGIAQLLLDRLELLLLLLKLLLEARHPWNMALEVLMVFHNLLK